jgi:hypothetical protein
MSALARKKSKTRSRSRSKSRTRAKSKSKRHRSPIKQQVHQKNKSEYTGGNNDTNSNLSFSAFKSDYLIDEKGNKIDDDYIKCLDNETKSLLSGKKQIQLSHLAPEPKRSKTFSRILNLNEVAPYTRRTGTFKRQLHWGQLKLFLSEVEFLNQVLLEIKSKKGGTHKKSVNKYLLGSTLTHNLLGSTLTHNLLGSTLTHNLSSSILDNLDGRQIIMVYAGAAPGLHIGYLQSLFPQIKFELYDPNKFAKINNEMISVHRQFFMDIDAEYWRDYAQKTNAYLVFVSDIRSEPASQENIIRNMSMQLKWWQIMQPELSMFKFRLPWEEGKTEYPFGHIYVQAFPGATSTETRLIVKKNAKLVEYDNKQYENACFYHNTVTREMYHKTKLGDLNLERDGLDNCYDCTSFIHIMSEYLKLTKKSQSLLVSLLQKVQYKISFGQDNIKNKTIYDIDSTLTRLVKACQPRDKSKSIGYGVATIENEEKAINARINRS